jgi:essential nuclear protein 1
LGAEAGSGGTRTLADIIFDRLNGDKANQAMEDEGEPHLNCDQLWKLMMIAGGPPDPRKGLNPKVVEAYTKYARSSSQIWSN